MNDKSATGEVGGGGGGSSTTKGESQDNNGNPFLYADDVKSDYSGGYL